MKNKKRNVKESNKTEDKVPELLSFELKECEESNERYLKMTPNERYLYDLDKSIIEAIVLCLENRNHN